MNQNTLMQGEPWMTPEERALNHEFIRSTTELLASRGVPESPLLMIRVNDVIVTWLLARRLESSLAAEPGEPAPIPTPAQAGAIGKCRDRLRRAMKELEACYPCDATPIRNGLEAQMHPITPQRSEPTSSDENPHHAETQETANIDPEPPHNHAPAKSAPNSAPPGVPAPDPPHATPTEQPPPPPPNRATRRRQAKENRRKTKVRPIHPRPS